MSEQKKKNLFIYITATIIPIIIALIGLVSGEFAPFGKNNILSAGDLNDLLPYYYELYDRVHESKSLVFSNTLGLGYDFSAILTYYLSDPTNYLILLFPRTAIISVLSFLYMFKIGFAGLSMSIFLVYQSKKYEDEPDVPNITENTEQKKNFVIGLTKEPKTDIGKFFKKSDWLIIAFSVAYALSTPICVNGLNITYLSAMAILPLVIMGLDKLINHKDCKMYTITLAISIYFNLYISIVSFIFIILFFFTRDFKDAKHFVYSFFRWGVSTTLALLCSGIIIINSAQSTFWKDELSLKFPILTYSNIFNSLKMLLSRSKLSALSLSSYVDLSFGILFVFLIFLSLFVNTQKPSVRIKDFLLFVLYIFGTVISVLTFLLNGFNKNAMTKANFSYILVFIGLFISFNTIINLRKIKAAHVIIATLLTAGLIVSSMLLSIMYDSSSTFITALEFLFIYFIITLIYINKSMTKSLYHFIVMIVLFIEIFPTFSDNLVMLGHSYMSHSIDRITSMKIYETSRYIHEKEPEAIINSFNPFNSNSTPLTNYFNGYDYILTLDGIENYDSLLQERETYLPYKESQGIKILSNPYNKKNIFLNSKCNKYIYDKDYPFTSSNILSEYYLGQKKIFNEIELSSEVSYSADKSSAQFSVLTSEPGDTYIKTFTISHLGIIENNDTLEATQYNPRYISYDNSFVNLAGTFNESNYSELYNKMNSMSNGMYEYINNKKNLIINIEKDGYITTNLPNIKSLKYKVNGKKVTPISFFDTTIIPVIPGNNEITVSLSYKYIIIGIVASLIGILLTIYMSQITKIKESSLINKIAFFIKDNYVYCISVIIVALMLFISMLVTSSYPFGPNSLVSNDGLAIDYPDYIARIGEIKNNHFYPFFTTNIGGFKDVYRSYAIEHMYKPWLILKYRLLPEKLYLLDFTLIFCFYTLLSSITIIYYLTHRNSNKISKHNKLLIVISVMYSLSNFGVKFFLYQAGFRYMPFLPLIILGLEQLFYKKKPALYVIMLSIMMNDPYHAFLLCEFLGLYFLTLNFYSLKDFVKKTLYFLKNSIYSAGLSAIYLIPFALVTKESPYLGQETVTPSIFKFYTSIIKVLANYKAFDNSSAISSDNSKACIYCGLIMISIIPIYLICTNIKNTIKIKKILLLLLLFLAFDNELLNFILHGFHFQTLVPNRFAAFFIFIIISILGDIVINYKYINNKIEIIIITCSIIQILLYLIYEERNIAFFSSIVFLSIYIAISICGIIKRKGILKIILYITIIELLSNQIVFFINNRASLNSITTAQKINILSDEIKDTQNFYNLSELISDISNNKNIGDESKINCLSYFSNTYTQKINDYTKYMNIQRGANTLFYSSGNPLADMFLKIKYHIVNKYDDTSYSIYNEIYQYNDLVLYKNPYYLSLGFVIPDINGELSKELDKKTLNKDFETSFDYQNYISNFVIGKNIYKKIKCTNKKSENVYYTTGNTYLKSMGNSTSKEYTQIYIHFNNLPAENIYVSVNGIIYCLGKVTPYNNELQIDYPKEDIDNSNFEVLLAEFDSETFNELYEKLNDNIMSNLNENGRTITGKIDAKIDGTLYISFPEYDGWQIYIDGKKVEKQQYLGGIGVPISKGKHDITMKYRPEGMIPGIIITLLTVILIILDATKTLKKNKS